MKTSNKLLLGFLAVILLSITVFLTAARFTLNTDRISGNGKTETKTIAVPPFNQIKVRGKINVYFTQGRGQKIEIKAAENLIPELQTEVEDGELFLHLKSKIGRKDRIYVYITAESINGLSVADGSKFESSNTLSGENLRLDCSSGSEPTISLKYANLDAEISSGAVVTLKGASDMATISESSGAMLGAFELSVKKLKIDQSSESHAQINVTEEISADVTSGAFLEYTGNPSEKNVNSSSGGGIEKK